MRKTIPIFMVVLLIAVSGCALKSATWSKRGVSMAQGEKDLAECSKKANLLNIYDDKYDDGVFYVTGSVLGNDPDKPGIIFQKCMEGKGYKKVK